MFVVVLPGPLLFYPWLEKLNEAAFALRIPWTTLGLVDPDCVQIGPTIRPGVTACYKCFETRLKSKLSFLGKDESIENIFDRRASKLILGCCLR